MTRFVIVDQNATGDGGHHLGYVRCVADAAQQRGFEVHWLCHRALRLDDYAKDLSDSGTLGQPIKVHPTYLLTSGEADARGLPSFGPRHIVFDTEKALRRLRIGKRDHVLIPTVGLMELEAWFDHWLAMSVDQLEKLPFFHLLLRFDPTEIEQDCSVVWGRIRRRLQQRQNDLDQFLHCCADTEILAVRYAQRLGLKVSLAPIPVNSSQLLTALSFPRKSNAAQVTLLYAGDARPEKGFSALLGLVNALWAGYLHCGKIRLVVQANLNVPGGQGNTSEVVTALSRCKAVDLMLEPLTPAAYCQQLAMADIVLLPYTVPNYQARSSGILMEALVAGKPVVTRAGTWLASQVRRSHAEIFNHDDELATAVLALLARLPAAKRAAQRQARRWQAFSAPTHFLDHLLEHVADQAMPAPECSDQRLLQAPTQPLVSNLLNAWLGHAECVAKTLDEQGRGVSSSLSSLALLDQLNEALPSVLCSEVTDSLPDKAKTQLLMRSQAFLAQLPVIGGMSPPIVAISQGRVHTQVVINGALQNTLVVQLRKGGGTGCLAPTFQLNGKLVLPVMSDIQENDAVFYYDIGPDSKGPYLQISDLILQLPIGNCWSWQSILIREKWTVEMMRMSWSSRRCWHEIEHDNGHSFAWSATPDIFWQWPSWRGVDKLLLLEAVSLRENQSSNLTFTLDGICYPLQTTEKPGTLVMILPKKKDWPFSAHAKLHCDFFGQAAVSDLRNIGIAMQQLVLVHRVF